VNTGSESPRHKAEELINEVACVEAELRAITRQADDLVLGITPQAVKKPVKPQGTVSRPEFVLIVSPVL
jgi:hypothetical protein